MSSTDHLEQIEQFGEHYQYNTDYIREMFHHSPEGFEKFAAFLPLASHRETLEPDVFWVAKIAAMQVADCGHCLQLNIRMALEAGVSVDIVKAAVAGGSKLPEHLKDIYDFSASVVSITPAAPALEKRIHEQLNKAQQIELGICIATTAIFPTIKRTLGYTQSCNLVELEFE